MDEPLFHLLTLPSIRERSSIVYKKAQAGKLSSFILHEDKLPVAADYVANLIKVSHISALLDSVTASSST